MEDSPRPKRRCGQRDQRMVAQPDWQEAKDQPAVIPKPPIVVKNNKGGECDPKQDSFHLLVPANGTSP
jgi:hypothetical protein